VIAASDAPDEARTEGEGALDLGDGVVHAARAAERGGDEMAPAEPGSSATAAVSASTTGRLLPSSGLS
jgi:hypothetical protein